MRMTQIFGLSKKAKEFLEENCDIIPNIVCPDCGKVINTKNKTEIYGDARSSGMFNDGPMLNRYHLKNGKVADEIVQSNSWSSGPCIFLCLLIDGEKCFMWPQKTIDLA